MHTIHSVVHLAFFIWFFWRFFHINSYKPAGCTEPMVWICHNLLNNASRDLDCFHPWIPVFVHFCGISKVLIPRCGIAGSKCVGSKRIELVHTPTKSVWESCFLFHSKKIFFFFTEPRPHFQIFWVRWEGSWVSVLLQILDRWGWSVTEVENLYMFSSMVLDRGCKIRRRGSSWWCLGHVLSDPNCKISFNVVNWEKLNDPLPLKFLLNWSYLDKCKH